MRQRKLLIIFKRKLNKGICSVKQGIAARGVRPVQYTVAAVLTKDEMAAIEQTVEACKNGKTLLIFPEGTREKEGKLLPPKSGLFVIAAGAGVDVVPCRILYDTPDGKMHLFCRVRVIYGEPMPAAQFAMEGRRDTKKLRANKQALLDAWEKMGA